MCNSHNVFLYSLIFLKSKLVKAADHLAFLTVENEVYCMDTGDFLRGFRNAGNLKITALK